MDSLPSPGARHRSSAPLCLASLPHGWPFGTKIGGLVELAAEQAGQRIAVLSIAAFLLVGGLLLLLVNERAGREAAERT